MSVWYLRSRNHCRRCCLLRGGGLWVANALLAPPDWRHRRIYYIVYACVLLVIVRFMLIPLHEHSECGYYVLY